MKNWFGRALLLFKGANWFYVLNIILFLYAVACYAGVKSVNVPTFHMDGAFQTASGLFRLLRGELPGRDFYPYLGIGPIALIFPIFWAAGAHLCASILASYITVFATNALSVALIIHLIWKPKNFLLSLLAACALFSIPFLFILNSSPLFMTFGIPYWLLPLMEPGNSLRPLRGFIGYIAIYAFYFFILPEKNVRRKHIYYGLSIALISLWSNDYVAPTMTALFLLSLGSFVKDGNTSFFKNVICLIVVSVISIILTQCLVTGGHPLKLVKYNFIDVARDQWWYFASWIELSKVFSWQELNKLSQPIQYQYAHYVLAASFASIFIFKHRRVELLLVFIAGAISFVGGVIACIGGHIMQMYFDGFVFWSKLFILLFGLRLIVDFLLFISSGWGKGILHAAFAFCCALIIGAYAFYANQEVTNFKNYAKNDVRNFYVPELGGYLTKDWKEYINYIESHKHKTIIEEYWGVWSAFTKKQSIWPVDSAIHALGSVRQTAEKAVREKADIVVTSNRLTASSEWLAWNQSSNYWLYKTLFENYTPVIYAPTTIVWEKDNPHPAGKTVACKIADGKDRIVLDTKQAGYYEIQLKTSLKKIKNNRFLIMFDNNMNYTTSENGESPLSPYIDDHTLLVFVPSAENNDFAFNVRPAGTVSVSIESCTAKEIAFKNEQVLLMSEGLDRIYDKHANDGSVYGDLNFWDRGLSTKKAGFFVYSDNKIINDYKMGRVVQLPNSEMRVITEVVRGFTVYLEIYLDGPVLNPDEVGNPSQFKLVPEDQYESLAMTLGDRVFLTNDIQWRNGISLISYNFIVANTKQNRELFKYPNKIELPDKTQLALTDAVPNGVYLLVGYSGEMLDSAKTGSPANFKVIEVKEPTPSVSDQSPSATNQSIIPRQIDVAKAAAIKDDFFLTNDTWINGVAFHSAIFFVKNTEENRTLFVVGKWVDIPNTDARQITKVVTNGIYMEVYVTGEPMDGSRVGLPSGFKVLSDQ